MTRTLFGLRFSLFVFTASWSQPAPSSRRKARSLRNRRPPLRLRPQRHPRRRTCHCGRTAMRSRARRRLLQCRRRRMMGRRRHWRAARASSRSRRFATASDRRTGIPAITPRCPRSSRADARTATFARARSATIPTEKGARKTRRCPACRFRTSCSRWPTIAPARGRAPIRRRATPTR